MSEVIYDADGHAMNADQGLPACYQCGDTRPTAVWYGPIYHIGVCQDCATSKLPLLIAEAQYDSWRKFRASIPMETETLIKFAAEGIWRGVAWTLWRNHTASPKGLWKWQENATAGESA